MEVQKDKSKKEFGINLKKAEKFNNWLPNYIMNVLQRLCRPVDSEAVKVAVRQGSGIKETLLFIFHFHSPWGLNAYFGCLNFNCQK